MAKIKRFFVDLALKMKENRVAFFVLGIVYLVGVWFYTAFEPSAQIEDTLLLALGLKQPQTNLVWSTVYQRTWEIFVELVFFGFLISVLLENYNPVVTSKTLAKHQKNHTVVVGYKHLGNRIVDELRKRKKPYALVERDEELVDELLKVGEPVVVGAYIDEENLELANVRDAKEVFLCINIPRETIVIAEKVRKMNKHCKLYIRIFNEQFQDYLKRDPIDAFTFSTSEWALESMRKWVDNRKGEILILGRDNLAQRLAEFVGLKRSRRVHIMDSKIDEDLYDEPQYDNINITKDNCERLRYIQDHISLADISTLFICWKREDEFSTSLYLVSQIFKKFPRIKVYCRIFDEELAKVVKKMGGNTFSTSNVAFLHLQHTVGKDSGIYLAPK